MVTVTIDSRIRNTSAVLAATSWVVTEQKPLPRGVHHEAASLRKHVEALNQADAATHIQNDLETGIEVSAFFDRALADDESFSKRLNDFSAKANLDSYWKEHNAVWNDRWTPCINISGRGLRFILARSVRRRAERVDRSSQSRLSNHALIWNQNWGSRLLDHRATQSRWRKPAVALRR